MTLLAGPPALGCLCNLNERTSAMHADPLQAKGFKTDGFISQLLTQVLPLCRAFCWTTELLHSQLRSSQTLLAYRILVSQIEGS